MRRKLFDLLRLRNTGRHLARSRTRRAKEFSAARIVHGAANAREPNDKEIKYGQLRRERLGGGHTDLGSSVGVQSAFANAGETRLHHVADGDRACALLERTFGRSECVRCFAALRDRYHQRAFIDHGIARTEFTRELAAHMNTAEVL